MKKIKIEYKVWLTYFSAIFISVYLHEIGHCIPAWFHGYKAIPTPLKEYLAKDFPENLKPYVSLGGIIGSVMFSVICIIIYLLKTNKYITALLAGSLVSPGIYTLRFILAGRGHDATEFQEAQSALGFTYSGHSLDWIFLIIFLTGFLVWLIKSKPEYKMIGKLAIGFILTFIFVVCMQVLNNAIFDPIFE